LAGCWAALLLAAGCGAVGDPLPPLLHIPARTTDLEARQIGAELAVWWTAPELTTEGTPVKELRRVVLLAAETESDEVDPEVFEAGARELLVLETAQPGQRLERRLPLPAPAGRRVALAVRNEGSRGRTAGPSNLVAVDIVPPLGRPEGLRATLAADSIRLDWNPVAGATGYQVFRRRGTEDFAALASVEAASFVDVDVLWEAPVAYFVRALAATSAGAAESLESEMAALTPEDTFPPSTPQDLRAVPAEGSVELSWSAAAEPDAAGYYVYRRGPAEAGGTPERLNPAPLVTPSFSDRNVTRGRQYSYSVSAVDQRGNESPRSEALEVTVP
jgi:hypothetical protein